MKPQPPDMTAMAPEVKHFISSTRGRQMVSGQSRRLMVDMAVIIHVAIHEIGNGITMTIGAIGTYPGITNLGDEVEEV